MIPVRQHKEILPEMKLPAGSGAKIEAWSKGKGSYSKENGFEDLPPVVSNLSDGKSTNRTEEIKRAIKKSEEAGFFNGRRAKNVIVIIGDGMGESHLKASRQFYGPLVMDSFSHYCSALTDCFLPAQNEDGSAVEVDANDERLVTTDSSAGGTAILCGERTRYGYIGLDKNGKEIKNLGERAREKGMLVGCVTNDHMGDSTPACAIVHEVCREKEKEIYQKELDFAPDLLFGHNACKEVFDGTNKMKCYERFYDLVEEQNQSGHTDKCASLWGGNFCEYEEDTKAGFNMEPVKDCPSFVEMVWFTLSHLDYKAKAKGDCGFFCMIENTCCDGWGHAQLVQQIMNEVQCFDEGVAVAAKFVLENPDTLLVITADHENGDLRFRSNWESDYIRIKSMDSGHSSQPVPVIAFGAGADERFPLRQDNVCRESFETGQDIAKIMEEDS